MVDLYGQLLSALIGLFTPANIMAMVFGTLGGIFLGALPGVTAAMSIAILLPFTFTLDPLVALGMIAGIYNGAMYGGAIPAVLLRIPGTPAAVVSTFDGYPLAQQGKASLALQVASYSSAIGGMLSAVALIFLAPPLSRVALSFGPPEMFWVGVFGLAAIVLLVGDNWAKGLVSGAVGLLLAIVGIDQVSGAERFVFNTPHLLGGLDIAVVLIGLFALPPAFQMIEKTASQGKVSAVATIKSGIRISSAFKLLLPTWLRSSLIGIVVGVLPGIGGNIASFLSYNEARRHSSEPKSFGHGSIEGLAASETANNADNASALIPSLTLGVPGNVVAALILGALLIHGLQPGPQLFRNSPDIAYGFMLQMFFTAALIIPLGGVLASRLFARVLSIPPTMLMPLIVATTVVGVYSINNSTFDILVLLACGLLGYVMEKFDVPLAPASLGLILGPMVEANLRISLLLSGGDPTILVTRPISVAVIILILAFLFLPMLVRRFKVLKAKGSQ